MYQILFNNTIIMLYSISNWNAKTEEEENEKNIKQLNEHYAISKAATIVVFYDEKKYFSRAKQANTAFFSCTSTSKAVYCYIGRWMNYLNRYEMKMIWISQCMKVSSLMVMAKGGNF